MDAIDLTGTVARGSLGLAPLALDVAGVYRIVSFSEGGVSWRRTTVQGKYQRGRRLVQAQQDTVSDVLLVRAYGSSWTEVNNRVKTLRDAFSQFSYQLTVTIAGHARTSECEPADMDVVGEDSRRKGLMFEYMREVQFTIPRDPQLIAGAF